MRSLAVYCLRNIRFLSTNRTYSRNQDVSQLYQFQRFAMLNQKRFSSSENQSQGAEIGREANNGSTTPPPPSGGPPIFTWAKWAIGSVFTLLIPFLYAQWKAMQKIEGEIDTAKEVAEKTAETVEKVAEMAEKASKEAADQLQDGKLKEAAEVIEKVSKLVEEDAHLVDDILHKVDAIEEDVKTLVEPKIKINKNDDNNKHEENRMEEHLN